MRATGRTEMKPYERKKLGPTPEDRPENNEALRMCVTAWSELEGDRHLGYGYAGPIPFSALVTWAEVNHLDRESFALLRHVIRQLENDRADRINSERKLKQPGGTGRARNQ